MSIQSVTEQGRRVAQARMTSTCTIGTLARSDTLDETTGEYPMIYTSVYVGPCEFKHGDTQVHELDAASQQLVEQNNTLKLPVAGDPRITQGQSSLVEKNMVVTIQTSASDSSLVGLKARVEGPASYDYTTARRFSVEVTT